MWRDILQKLSEDLTFNPPASAEEIARIAGELGTGLRMSFADIFSESNGIEGKYGLGLLWDGARILQDNRLFRSSPISPISTCRSTICCF